MSDVTGLGNLAQCMVDCDRAGNTRAKRLRSKALALSIALEAIVIGGVLVLPLATLGVLPPQQVLTPLPRFGDTARARSISSAPRRPFTESGHHFQPRSYQPPRIPERREDAGGDTPPGFDQTLGASATGIAEGFSDTQPMVIAPPEPPTPPRRVQKRSEGVMEAQLVHRVEPVYPPLAMTIHLSGTVLLRARIGGNGEVRDVEVVSGNTLLAQAALAAVRQWRYRPTLLNGQAVEVETQITVHFVMNGGE
jgi:TonB family protein